MPPRALVLRVIFLNWLIITSERCVLEGIWSPGKPSQSWRCKRIAVSRGEGQEARGERREAGVENRESRAEDGAEQRTEQSRGRSRAEGRGRKKS
jgi:hypothetical protein